MIKDLMIIGGLYREISPKIDLFLGSGGRATLFLAAQNVNVQFITSATNYACRSFQASRKSFFPDGGQITIDNQEVISDISFEYNSYLFDPLFKNSHEIQKKQVNTDNCLYFGMLNAEITVNVSHKAVYDPQNTSNPKTFKETGSTAKELAIVLNEHEAKAMVGNLPIPELIRKVKEFNNADLVILKRGPYGATLLLDNQTFDIPVFLSKKFHKIGSGDIFSACFSYSWIVENLSPLDAALNASKAVSVYVENQKFEKLSVILAQDFIELEAEKFAKKIYLAAPFFSISELWLVEKIKAIFELYDIEVFSPYHDVGMSNNFSEIAQADLLGLEKSDGVFAIANNFDPGTIFEIGYAKALQKNVCMYLNYAAEKDLAMFEGTMCLISDDIDYLIYKAIWNQ